MGGSQVFLEEGEKQTVDTLLKCILVASGNDASVAMAEYIGGSEEAFVQKMNERAAALGMENTHFVDCCGLTDSDDHYTTPRDIAIDVKRASAELSTDRTIHNNLDGGYHTCDGKRQQCLWAYQHQQASQKL